MPFISTPDVFFPTKLNLDLGLWRSHVTHCIGQDGAFSLVNNAKRLYEAFQDWRNEAQDFHNDNKLLHEYTLDDGRVVFEFVRYNNPWGEYSNADEPSIIHQLGPDVIDELIENEGRMIFYTHFGVSPSQTGLSDSTVAALRYIAQRADDKELLVATTTRLLNYCVNTEYLHWHTMEHDGSVSIIIDSIMNGVDGRTLPAADDLQGLTFCVPEDIDISLVVGRSEVKIVENPPDHSGRRSISIPWRPLTFPSDLLPSKDL